jgi:hypothetical protein
MTGNFAGDVALLILLSLFGISILGFIFIVKLDSIQDFFKSIGLYKSPD